MAKQYIALHPLSHNLIKSCLPFLKEACEKGDSDPRVNCFPGTHSSQKTLSKYDRMAELS